MKLTKKQIAAITALIGALITGVVMGPQDNAGSKSDQHNATRQDLARNESTPAASRQQRSGSSRTSNARNIAGEFDYYALVLSWSPTYCATRTSSRRDPQCDVRNGRAYAFVLHGLWPQYSRGYPESCWTREKPYVPRKLINRMLDIMPSPGLVIHEYKKHGTCSGLGTDEYFAMSRKLYAQIKIPAKYKQPRQRLTVSPDQLMREFAAVNPGLREDMMAVSCGGSGSRLREVRICFSRGGELQSCGRNENQRRLCSAKRMFVPPVRVAAPRR